MGTADVTSEDPPSGLELFRALRDGRVPRPGLAVLLDMRIIDVEEGRVVFELATGAQHGNPLGTVHGGVTATLLDSAMGCAVHSALAGGVSYTTVDLAVTYLRAVPLDGQVLQAEGRLVHLGRRIATADGRVTDEQGRLVATGTTTCMILAESSP